MRRRVAIVGVGGLGLPCAWQLVRLWNLQEELQLLLIDPDTVALDNLNRQVLYGPSDQNRSKVSVLSERLVDPRFPPASGRFSIQTSKQSLTIENIADLLNGADYVVDGTDSVETKFLLNDYCKANQIPLCYGGAVGYTGLLLPMEPIPLRACLRCLFGDFNQQDYSCAGPTCRESGILGPIVGIIGALQAEKVYQWFLSLNKQENPPVQMLSRLSAQTLQMTQSKAQASQDCPNGCGFSEKITVNLLDKVCPQTFLFTKLALEQLPPNGLLDVRLKDIETTRSVSSSAQEEGYSIVGNPHLISRDVVQLLIARK